MADISKIITPDGSTYDLKDTAARNSAAAAIAAIPSNVSELNNDSGYITVSAIPSNVSAFNNDAGYITGYGTPSGGNTNEVLMKASNSDYDFAWRQMSKSFSITLDSTAWIDSSLTVVNADFQATGYVYLIAPLSTSFALYGSAGVYADDVTTDNQMVFHCSKTVDSDLVVNVVRLIV